MIAILAGYTERFGLEPAKKYQRLPSQDLDKCEGRTYALTVRRLGVLVSVRIGKDHRNYGLEDPFFNSIAFADT